MILYGKQQHGCSKVWLRRRFIVDTREAHSEASGSVQTEPGHERREAGGEQEKKEEKRGKKVREGTRSQESMWEAREHMAQMAGLDRKREWGGEAQRFGVGCQVGQPG